jgi:hypothetical protein
MTFLEFVNALREIAPDRYQHVEVTVTTSPPRFGFPVRVDLKYTAYVDPRIMVTAGSADECLRLMREKLAPNSDVNEQIVAELGTPPEPTPARATQVDGGHAELPRATCEEGAAA